MSEPIKLVTRTLTGTGDGGTSSRNEKERQGRNKPEDICNLTVPMSGIMGGKSKLTSLVAVPVHAVQQCQGVSEQSWEVACDE